MAFGERRVLTFNFDHIDEWFIIPWGRTTKRDLFEREDFIGQINDRNHLLQLFFGNIRKEITDGRLRGYIEFKNAAFTKREFRKALEFLFNNKIGFSVSLFWRKRCNLSFDNFFDFLVKDCHHRLVNFLHSIIINIWRLRFNINDYT